MLHMIRNNTLLMGLAGLVFLMVAIAGYRYIGGEEESGGGMKFGPVGVTSAVVKTEKIPHNIEALGTAKSNESVIITSKVTETVGTINFLDGEIVDKDAVLVELTNDEEIAQLAEEKATLAEAEKQYKRIKNLVTKNAATQSRLDEQFALMNSAKARVLAIEARISDRLIKAPFSGLLGLRDVSPGSLVTPGTQITTLDDINRIKLDFLVPETLLSNITKGSNITATAATYPGMVFTGTVDTIDLRIDPVTRSATVRAVIPNQDMKLKPGMLMNVKIQGRETQSMVIPEASLVPLQDKQFVLLIDDKSIAQQREVKLGKRIPGKVEVLSGLKVGDRIIVDGTIKVKSGMPVQVLENKKAAK